MVRVARGVLAGVPHFAKSARAAQLLAGEGEGCLSILAAAAGSDGGSGSGGGGSFHEMVGGFDATAAAAKKANRF